MKWLIDDLYEIIDFDPDYMDLFDLYYVLRYPSHVSFYYNENMQVIESVIEDGACVVHFNDKWYHDRDEFFKKAAINGRKLTSLNPWLYGFDVTMDIGEEGCDI